MDLDLVCCESNEGPLRARLDPALMLDSRVLANLLKTEEYYIPNSSYFECVQTDVTPKMRKIVAEWMFEVCAEQECLEEVFPLAVNLMDRFLSLKNISRTEMQLVSVACILIASKLREPEPININMLARYTANSCHRQNIAEMEHVVAVTLRYDLLGVTAHDFLQHIIVRLPLPRPDPRIQRHAETLIGLCARDYKFILHPPSLIAGSSVIAALHGLDYRQIPGFSLPGIVELLHNMLGIEKDYLVQCHTQIEDMISQEFGSSDVEANPKPETPTDVQDVHF